MSNSFKYTSLTWLPTIFRIESFMLWGLKWVLTMSELTGLNARPPLKEKPQWFTLFPADIKPRMLLFFFSIPLQLIASGLSGVGYSTGNGVFWLTGTIVWGAWFWLIFLIVIPQTDISVRRHYGGLKRAAKVIFTVMVLGGIGELCVLVFFAPGYLKSGANNDFSKSLEQMRHSFGYYDATALDQQAAENLLDGKNPYAAPNIVEAFIEYGGSYDHITPLQTGRLKDVFPYPTQEQLKQIWDSAVKNPSAIPPEIESHVSYPSGSFLLLAPFIAAGIQDIRWIYMIFVLAGLVYAVWQVPGNRRLLFAGLVLISLELWNSLAIGETGSLIFPFLLIAWISLGKNNWLSAITMGIAVATKQTAWFFLPFYLILIWRTSGVKTAAMTTGIIAAVFVAFNAYFMAIDPALWLKSLTSPMDASMFPMGVGIISVVTSGLVEIRSSLPFAIMELAVFTGSIIWYWRNCRRYPDAGIVLAVLPFFFAWRSIWTYFYYVTIIILARMLISKSESELQTSAIQEQLSD
jgi:hypothetical protein